MDTIPGEEQCEATKHGPVRHAVERRVVECPENRSLSGLTRDRPVNQVADRAESHDPPREHDVATSVEPAANDRRDRPEGGDGIRVNSFPDQQIDDRRQKAQETGLGEFGEGHEVEASLFDADSGRRKHELTVAECGNYGTHETMPSRGAPQRRTVTGRRPYGTSTRQVPSLSNRISSPILRPCTTRNSHQ